MPTLQCLYDGVRVIHSEMSMMDDGGLLARGLTIPACQVTARATGLAGPPQLRAFASVANDQHQSIPPASPSRLISTGFANLVRYVNRPLASSPPPIGSPQQRADPQTPEMNARFLRPFARAAFRAPTAVRPSVMARPALIASQNKKTEVGSQQMVRLYTPHARNRG